VGALADADRALELEPDNVDAMVPKVVALLGLHRQDEAAAALDALEAAHSDADLDLHGSPPLCAARATFAKEKGEVEEAAKRFDECLKQFPAEGMVVGQAIAFLDANGRRKRSEEILQNALAASPETFEYRAMLVDRLRKSGREEEAEALLRAATELKSPGAAAVGFAALGLYSIETGKYDEAADALERASALDPTGSAELLFAHADALVVAGRHDEALKLAEQMKVPAHRSLVRGRVALARGEPAQALAHFSEGNRLWPNNAVSRYYAAAAAEQIGDFGRAIEDYRYSMRIDVRATDAYLRLARMQVAAGRVADAMASLEFQPGERPGEDEASLLEIELVARTNRTPPPEVMKRLERSNRAGAAAALARGLTARSGPKSAVEFLRAQQKDLDFTEPRDAAALAAYADALAASGNAKEALSRVDAALSKHPDAASFQALRGDALAKTGAETAAVRAAYQRALELDPREHRALAGLAGLDAGAGAAESALAFYDRAAEVDPSDRASVRAAAKLLEKLGRTDQAEERLTALLRNHPYDAEAAIALAELRRARGADAAATRELARRAVLFGGGSSAQALLDEIDAKEPKPTGAAEQG
jgi:tetratricopeptide (TPR) repeat protein